MADETVYDFEWDPAKALSNIRKHGVSFDVAATLLMDRLALTVYDEANSQYEERWFTLGLDARGNLIAVATHTRSLIRQMFAYALFRPAKRPHESAAITKTSPDR